MTDHELADVEISSWWGVATIGLIFAGGAVVIARTIGAEAVETLINGSLMLIFIVGGLLLGLLSTQALGASQHWGLIANTEQPVAISKSARHRSSITDYATEFGADLETDFEAEDELDPFYEVMKQNRSRDRAA